MVESAMPLPGWFGNEEEAVWIATREEDKYDKFVLHINITTEGTPVVWRGGGRDNVNNNVGVGHVDIPTVEQRPAGWRLFCASHRSAKQNGPGNAANEISIPRPLNMFLLRFRGNTRVGKKKWAKSKSTKNKNINCGKTSEPRKNNDQNESISNTIIHFNKIHLEQINNQRKSLFLRRCEIQHTHVLNTFHFSVIFYWNLGRSTFNCFYVQIKT